MSEEELRPSLIRRRRRRLGLAVALAIPTQLAGTVALLAYCTPRPRTATYVFTTQAVHSSIVIPFATPILSTVGVPQAPGPAPGLTAGGRRASCPPPRTEAPRIIPPELDEPIENVQPAVSNAGWIAAWNTEHVFVSTDAGASFSRVLDGPGAVRDVDFDCHGNVIVLRGALVGMRSGPREHWRSIPGVQLADKKYGVSDESEPPHVSIIGGGPDLAVAGHEIDHDSDKARLAVSEDLGESWRYYDLHSSVEGPMIGRQREDGRIDLGVIVVDCRSEDLLWVRVENGVAEHLMQWIPGMNASLSGDLALTGTQWRRRRSDEEDWTPITGLPADSRASVLENSTILVEDTVAYKVSHGRARKLPWRIEGSGIAADPAGRIWSVVCGQPWIAQRTPSGRTCDDAQ